MRLAIVGPNDDVIVSWPTVADAHACLTDELAADLYPGGRVLRKRKRRKLAEKMRGRLLDLQQQTQRL